MLVFFARYILVLTLFFLVSLSYNFYLMPLYEYRGAGEIIDFSHQISLLLFISFFYVLVVPVRLVRPGDYFLVVYVFFGFLMVFVLGGNSEYYYQDGDVYYRLAFLFSVLVLAFINKLSVVSVDYDVGRTLEVSERGVYFIIALNLIVLLYVYFKVAENFSIEYEGYHERRVLGKEAFSERGIGAYLISWLIHGVYPVLFFLAFQYRRPFFAVIAILNVIVLWGGFGERYPFFISFLCMMLSLFLFFWKGRSLRSDLLVVFMIFLVCLGVVELWVYETDLINDHLLRRLLVVPSVIGDAWLNFSITYKTNSYCDTGLYVLSCASREIGLPYQVSSVVLGDHEMNANTNYALVAIARGGYLGIMFETFVLGVVILILNTLYKISHGYLYIGLGLMLGLKVMEQALTVTLFTSGIAFMIIISAFILRHARNV